MEFLGIEIYDGMPIKDHTIELDLPVEKQWFYNFYQDITCIDYTINEQFEFSLDIDWEPESKLFRIKVIEGTMSDGGLFFTRCSASIELLQHDVSDAVTLIQEMKGLGADGILAKSLPDFGMDLTQYEQEAIRCLLSGQVDSESLTNILNSCSVHQYEHTGSGYFIQIICKGLGLKKQTLSTPGVTGKGYDLVVGFVLFVGDDQLTLECHSWGEKNLPENIRYMDLQISAKA